MRHTGSPSHGSRAHSDEYISYQLSTHCSRCPQASTRSLYRVPALQGCDAVLQVGINHRGAVFRWVWEVEWRSPLALRSAWDAVSRSPPEVALRPH